MSDWNYETLKGLVAGEPLPLMVVDLDRLERNTRRFAQWAQACDKTVRIATKSVRVPDLLRVILAAGGPAFRGLMCYSAREAALLADVGFDDLLVAYPTPQAVDLEALHSLTIREKRVSLVVDSPEHIDRIEQVLGTKSALPLNVCIEIDVSLRPFGPLHLGAQRSPVRSLPEFVRLFDRIGASSRVRLSGVMAYEAHIAGVPDRIPGAPFMNTAVSVLKRHSQREVRQRRTEVAAFLRSRGVQLDFFNGGGTGSFLTTLGEDSVTEVTVGSGLLQSQLFDYFAANRSEPAFCFALPVTRKPEPGMVTCHSGGFIASGPPGWEKAPRPLFPALTPLDREGYGEVQTPLAGAAADGLRLGDPVFFRPAKAGEIAERFPEYLLIREGAIVGRAPTYRGLGHCFF